MKNMLTIIKKDLKRFFTDKRMIMSLIIPGIMIFIMYSVMGSVMGNAGKTPNDYKYNAVIENISQQELISTNHIDDKLLILETSYDELMITYDELVANKGNKDEIKRLKTLIDSIKSQIELLSLAKFDFNVNYDYETDYSELLKKKEIDLVIRFSDTFYNDVLTYDPLTSDPSTMPAFTIIFNSSNKNSLNAYNDYKTYIDAFSDVISTKFIPIVDNQAEESAIVASIITSIIPFLLITFLFTGAMSISIEAIAGEKERGTIATLLATPTKRSDIALGKIISLSLVSLLSATSSFLGLFLSLPKLLGDTGLSFNIYGPGTFILLFIVIFTTILIFVVLVSLVSAYAKNVKEASALSSVLMIVNMGITVPSMAGVTASGIGSYFIPIYNSVQLISSILNFEFNVTNFIVTIIVNLLFVVLGAFILTKMFDSEKIMFNK